MSEWMNQFEVAALLRVSVNTLSRWRRAKRGPALYTRLEGSTIILYDRAAVEAYLATRTTRPALAPAATG